MQMDHVLSCVTEMVSIIGQDDFEDRFFGIAGRMVEADHCTVFVSQGTGIRTLVAQARTKSAAEQVRLLAGRYCSAGYRDDPVWNQSAAVEQEMVETRLISPAYFEQNYRREFYETPNILEEIAMFGRSSGGKHVYASFYREHGHGKFSNEDLGAIQACAQVTMQVLAKHAEVTSANDMQSRKHRPPSREELFKRVKSAILEDNGLLTPREAEVCSGIILGFTILGLSMNMGISVNTVATHRKRAYAKLRISSQNELFAHYFSLVESLSTGDSHLIEV